MAFPIHRRFDLVGLGKQLGGILNGLAAGIGSAILNWLALSVAHVAELADALDSGSSE